MASSRLPGERNDLRSRSLDLMRFPLALVVLFVHCFEKYGISIGSAHFDSPAVMAVCDFVSAFLREQSVPIYFFIAGYVFFYGGEFNSSIYAGKLRRRCRSLLIPYLVWNSLELINVVRSFVKSFPDGPAPDLSPGAILMAYIDVRYGPTAASGWYDFQPGSGIFPVDTPLWFVETLMVVVLLSPLIYLFLKYARRYGVISLGVIWFAVEQHIHLGFLNQMLTALFFFGWGGYMSTRRMDMIREFGELRTASFILYPLLGVAWLLVAPRWPEVAVWIKNINVIVGLFFAYNLASWLVGTRKVKVSRFLAGASFYFYAGHIPVLHLASRWLCRAFIPADGIEAIICQLAAALLTTAILLMTYWALTRYAPRFARLLTGGR